MCYGIYLFSRNVKQAITNLQQMQVSGKSSAEVERQTDHILTLMTDAILELKAIQVQCFLNNHEKKTLAHCSQTLVFNFICTSEHVPGYTEFLVKGIHPTITTQFNAKLESKSILIATVQPADIRPPQAPRQCLEEP